MKLYYILVYVLIIIGVITACKTQKLSQDLLNVQRKYDRSQIVETITFGSCNKHNKPQPLWNAIVENDPNIWIWLGDNVYGDTEDMEVLKSKYITQKINTEYQKLYQSECDIIGTWDDHDYGVNDGGKEYPKKEESKQILFDFLDVPSSDPSRQRVGASTSYIYGPKDQQVKVVLLDARSFRDPLNKNALNHNIPNETGDILGEEQWTWLEAELKNSTAQIHIIGSGIQFLPEEHRFEKWANFPTARQRLLDLLKEHQVPSVIMLSGDRHIGEISKYKDAETNQAIYEVTSSGMTHSYKGNSSESNQYRQGNIVNDLNFGMIQIDWSNSTPQISLQLRSENNVIKEEVEAVF